MVPTIEPINTSKTTSLFIVSLPLCVSSIRIVSFPIVRQDARNERMRHYGRAVRTRTRMKRQKSDEIVKSVKALIVPNGPRASVAAIALARHFFFEKLLAGVTAGLYFAPQSRWAGPMRDLDRALAEISEIRCQIARDTEFRGYGPATAAATGVFAACAAVIQQVWLKDPTNDVFQYLALWVATAAVSVAVVAGETVTRSRREHSVLADEMIQAATEQLLPSGVAGVLLTVVLLRSAPQSLWLLPGLWQIIFSLGVFASCHFLPRTMYAVGVWYLGAGLACIVFANGELAFSPLAMGLPFGVGQLLVAAVLHADGGDRND
jgi:hypothetical protein